MPKQFLYLVQSRIKFLDRHQVLESDNADVIVLVFEQKINKPNFIYAPNTHWDTGRHVLIEYARELTQQYEYYIFLDDDVEFIQGDFRKFEQIVLNTKPDVAVPQFNQNAPMFWFDKINRKTFKSPYSKIILFDQCFICFTKQLFFNKNLLTYATDFSRYGIKDQINTSYLTAHILYLNLFQYVEDKKLIQFNEIKIKNINAEANYTRRLQPYQIYDLLFLNPKHRLNMNNATVGYIITIYQNLMPNLLKIVCYTNYLKN